MHKFLLLLTLFKVANICAEQPVLPTAPLPQQQMPSIPSYDSAYQTASSPAAGSLPEWAPAAHTCTAAVFQVIETKMNRTRTITVTLTTSVRYNTLVIQPQSCVTQTYAGDHHNTTVYVGIWTLPYRVMIEPKLVTLFPPTLVFSGLMSTISPTFAHPNYAIIPVGCQTVPCTVGG